MGAKVNRIDQLIAEQQSVGNDVLKKALARQIEQEQKIAEDKLLRQFSDAKAYLTQKVSQLRQVRDMEKTAMKAVKKADDAFEQFKKDGDYNTFVKSVRGF